MTSPSQSQDPLDSAEQSAQIEKPISIHVENNPQNEEEFRETLETSRNQDPERSDPNLEKTQLVLEQQDEEEEYTGNVITITKIRNGRKVHKRKKPGELKKQQTIDKKVQILLELGTFVSFIPSKTLDFEKYESLLNRLGLWDFVHIEFDESVRANLIGQFIVSYDVTKRCCYVNGLRINVNRSSFARALKLPKPFPTKKDKGVGSVVEAAIDLDSVWEKVSEDCVAFVKDFVWNWVLLHGDAWVMPKEIRSWMGSIEDGHPEKVDWATLIWVMLENELKQRDQLRTCYYTSHLQYFIKSQRKELFEGEWEKVVANEEMKEEGKSLCEDDNKQVEVDEIKKEEDLLEEPHKVDEEVAEEGGLLRERLHEAEAVEKVKEGPNELEVEEVKEDADGSFYDLSKEEENVVLEEPNIGLTLGKQDIVEKEEINDNNIMDVEECKEKKHDVCCLAGNDNGRKHFLHPCMLGEVRGLDGNEGKQEVEQLEMKEAEHMKEVKHFLHPCTFGEDTGSDGNEEGKQEVEPLEIKGEQLEDVEHIQEEEHMQEWEQMEAEEADDVDEVEVDEIDAQLQVEDEELEDGIERSIAPNYGSQEGADLPGDLLQAFETAQLPLNLQGQQLDENASIDLFASNAETHLIMGGPSMYGNGHKRAMDYEQDTSLLNESKRIRTDVGWDQKTSDFGFLMGQAGHFMEKAKIMYEEKEQAFNNLNLNQQYLLGELQQKDNIIEHLQRNKNEEVEKKDREIYRLERELGLLGELVNGYREALKQNRRVFLEYRQRCQLPEEAIYKDAGPGGLVLSVRELEKQRQQQEKEERLMRLMIEQKYNEAFEDYVNQYEVLFNKVEMIDINMLTPIENEVKLLKELYAAKRRASEKEGLVK